MAHKATTWAWDVEGLSIPQKFLLVALADMADEAYSCFPGQALLARMTGAKSKRSVVNNLAALEDLGYIRRERRNRSDGSRTSDRFVMVVGHQHPLSAPDAPGGVVHEMQGLSASDDASKVHLTTGQGARDALEENPQRNHQKEPPASTPVVPAVDPVAEAFERFWSWWPAERRGSKKKAASSWRTAVGVVGMQNLERLVRRIQDSCTLWAGWAASERKYVPYVTTWLNQERWTMPLPEGGRGQRPTTIDTARAAAEILAARGGEQKAIAS